MRSKQLTWTWRHLSTIKAPIPLMSTSINFVNWWIVQSTPKVQTLCCNSDMGWALSSRTTLPVSPMVNLLMMSPRIGMMLRSSAIKIALQTLPSNQLCSPLEPLPLLEGSPLQPCHRGYQACALCSNPGDGYNSIYQICIKTTMRPQCDGCWCDLETRPKSHSVLPMWEDRSHQT